MKKMATNIVKKIESQYRYQRQFSAGRGDKISLQCCGVLVVADKGEQQQQQQQYVFAPF